MMAELVPRLRRFEELSVSDEVATALVAMSAATMDRRLAPDRAKMQLRGRSHTKPGTLLKSQIPIRTWAQWTTRCPDSWRSIWSGTRAATRSVTTATR
jgi:hypothetical protein